MTQPELTKYLYDKNNDVLGSGATSTVYKARNMDTGEFVAIKIFNAIIAARYRLTITREFELLEKVKNVKVVKDAKNEEINVENIVKLLAYELPPDHERTKIPYILLEYCNGGTLASIIDRPENAFGLDQSEFLLVLKHITTGVKALRELKIAHRDIKPNNILLHIMPNGEHIYKISDFGGAKIVEEDTSFNTIVGTEEYLAPDIYERAFGSGGANANFKPTVDLWSIGVTLYHISTGLLPFRPLGGRDNRKTMFEIIKQKPTGAISGVQRGDKIEYDFALPLSCRLEPHLQQEMAKMLGGLLANKELDMWSFQKFFDYSERITNKILVTIFYINKSEIYEIPFNKNDVFSNLIRETQVAIGRKDILLFYNNMPLDLSVKKDQLMQSYPKMDESNPVVVLSLDAFGVANLNITVPRPLERVMSIVKDKITVSDAYTWAKNVIAGAFIAQRSVHRLFAIMDITYSTVNVLQTVVRNQAEKEEKQVQKLEQNLNTFTYKIEQINKVNNCIQKTDAWKKTSFDLNNEESLIDLKRKISHINKELPNVKPLIKDTEIAKFKLHFDTAVNNLIEIFSELAAEKEQTRYRSPVEPLANKYTCFKVKQLEIKRNEVVNLFKDILGVFYQKKFNAITPQVNSLIKIYDQLRNADAISFKLDNSLKKRNEEELNKNFDTLLAKISNLNNLINERNDKIQEHIDNIRTTPTVSSAAKSTSGQVPIGFDQIASMINDTSEDSAIDNDLYKSMSESVSMLNKSSTETFKSLDESIDELKRAISKLDQMRTSCTTRIKADHK